MQDVVLFVLENCLINGFCFLSYTYQRQDLARISTQICDFKFTRKAVSVNFGANFTKTFSYKNWKKHCSKFFNHFYTSNGTVTEVITVPDITGKREDGSCWSSSINTLKKWCTFSQNSLGLIVTNYDIKEHLLFLGATESLLRETLNIENFSKDKEMLIVFNACERVIFIIHFALENLNEKVARCIEDVRLFSLLLKKELNESGVVIAGLIAYHGKTKHASVRCDHCKYLIVAPEVFESPERFMRFFKHYKIESNFNKIETETIADNKDQVFRAVSSKILGYMARYKTAFLPTLQVDSVKNIEQAEMLLDRYQMEIVYSRENRVILRGDYGSGKTVIALKKIQLLLKTIKDKEVIYYVNFTCKSEVHFFIKDKLNVLNELNQKLYVILGGYDLSYIVKSIILPKEDLRGTKMIHLFVDEYFSENLTIKEANALSDIFSNTKQFKNSTVLIAAQPIEIDRTDYYYVGKKETEHLKESHAFDILAKNMKVHTLKYVMRTTVQINELVQVTEKFLNNQSNEYTRQLVPEKKKASTIKLMPLKINKALHSIKWNTSLGKGTGTERNSTFYVDLPSQATLDPLPNSQQSSRQVSISDTASNGSQKTIDHDELHKLTYSTSSGNKKKTFKTVTTYRYSCNSKIGHGILGPLPNVIWLPPSADKYEQIALIGMLLKKIEKIECKRVVFIHFEPTNPYWLMSLLQSRTIFPSIRVTEDLQTFLKEHSDNLILVKNYNNVKGLEFPQVLMILDANEYHLKQYIPETMARSQSTLSILIKSFDSTGYNKDTVADLVQYWDEVNKKGKNTILNLSYLQFCDNTMCFREVGPEFCLENDESVSTTTYHVHKNCNLYKDLLADVTDKTNQTIEANDEAKRTALSL